MRPLLRRSFAVLAAALLAAVVWWASLPLGSEIAGALAITVLAAVLWISEALPLPVTALLIPVGLSALGVFEAGDAFTSFGNPVLILVLGGYALAVAVEANGVDRWLAHSMLRLAGTRTVALLITFMATSALLSMLISNTATTALLIPVVAGVIARHSSDANLAKAMMLGVAYGASIGGAATLTGSAPNAIAAGLLDISFAQWMAYGLPISAVMLLAAIGILWWSFPPKTERIAAELEERPPLTASGCVTWKALEKGVHWGVLLLLGGGLSLGRGLTESGAADWLALMLTSQVTDWGPLALTLALVTTAIFATELISNTAVTAKLAPIVMGVALHLGLEAESLVVPVAIAASMAFMLPVATPPNALVHASGHVLQRDMMRVGLRLNLAAIAVNTLLFNYIL